MYGQKRFDRENPTLELENIIRDIRKVNKDFGYRRIYGVHKLYLDPFMNMYNSEIHSYDISKNPSAQNILTALNQAIEITSDCCYRRTFHSDQGWAYQMKAYGYTLKTNRIFQSMSRKGNCYDNSIMENFFGALKQEMYYGMFIIVTKN